MVDYYIDNYSFRGFGIIVQESTGVVDLPKFKPPTEHDWAEYNGTIVDTEKTPRTEARQIQLKCALSAANQTDFLTKVNAFQSVFMTKGLKRLAIILTHDVGLFFDVYMSDGLQITKRWRDSQMVGQFTVTLTEPEPRKKIIRYDSQDSTPLAISFKNTEAVSVYWGDGEYSQDLYGNVSLSHTYDEPGIYFAIIHGNIEELSEFETNGEELGANNGGAIDIDVPEILNDVLTNVELYTTAEPDVTTLVPYLKFTFNNNGDTRILRITIDYSLTPNIDSVLSETSPNAVRNSTITIGINSKADKIHSHAITEVTNLNSTLNGLDTRIDSNSTAITTINNKIGSANGIAQLDSTSKVPTSQLPESLNNVKEYANASAFPATGESNVIYIAKDTNNTYRWGGSAYVKIGNNLELGETSDSAYRGDRGKTAYDHSQKTGNPHGTTIGDISGLRSELDAIPTELAELTSDSTHRTVTDSQIQRWDSPSVSGLQQVTDLSSYQGVGGEIVQYIGETTSDYTKGYVYIGTVITPSGSIQFTMSNNRSISFGNETANFPSGTTYTTLSKLSDTLSIVIYSGNYYPDGGSPYLKTVIARSDWEVGDYMTFPPQMRATTSHDTTLHRIYDDADGFEEYFPDSTTTYVCDVYDLGNDDYLLIPQDGETTGDYTEVYLMHDFNGVYGFAQYYAILTTITEDVVEWQQHNVQPSFSGSYNDLTDKPLSVDENNKVIFTPGGSTTALSLAQESTVKDIPIPFTPSSAAIKANIESGDTLKQMSAKISNYIGGLNIAVLGINDYTLHLAIIDVTDWYNNNSQTNYYKYIVGTCNVIRTWGTVDVSTTINICAIVNWNRNYKLNYSKNNNYK